MEDIKRVKYQANLLSNILVLIPVQYTVVHFIDISSIKSVELIEKSFSNIIFYSSFTLFSQKYK
jgi:hypothetical protein